MSTKLISSNEQFYEKVSIVEFRQLVVRCLYAPYKQERLSANDLYGFFYLAEDEYRIMFDLEYMKVLFVIVESILITHHRTLSINDILYGADI